MDDVIREVNAKKKRFDGLITISVIVFAVWVVVMYIVFLQDVLEGTFIAETVSHIKDHVATFTLLGSFYIALFGGLFFIFVPMEAYFMNALYHSDPFTLYAVFVSGIIMSYSLDYYIGMKFSKLSRRLISPKKFYGTKIYLNRYGQAAVFAAHAIPFLPSQQVTFILGVFRYNKAKLIMLALPAQMIKYSLLLAIMSLF